MSHVAQWNTTECTEHPDWAERFTHCPAKHGNNYKACFVQLPVWRECWRQTRWLWNVRSSRRPGIVEFTEIGTMSELIWNWTCIALRMSFSGQNQLNKRGQSRMGRRVKGNRMITSAKMTHNITVVCWKLSLNVQLICLWMYRPEFWHQMFQGALLLLSFRIIKWEQCHFIQSPEMGTW